MSTTPTANVNSRAIPCRLRQFVTLSPPILVSVEIPFIRETFLLGEFCLNLSQVDFRIVKKTKSSESGLKINPSSYRLRLENLNKDCPYPSPGKYP